MFSTRRVAVALPLSLGFMVSMAACEKLQELAGEKPEAQEATPTEAAEAAAPPLAEAPEPEPIPVEPMLSGLDLMLAFVPTPDAEFVVVRDASVFRDYAEEAARFLEQPATSGPTDLGPLSEDLAKVQGQVGEVKLKVAELVAAITSSGLHPEAGGVFVEVGGKTVVVFAADHPNAVANLAKALDAEVEMKCHAIPDKAGWNACASDQATLDAYKPATDPAPLRAALASQLVGVNLDEANVVALLGAPGAETRTAASVATLPGLVRVAIAPAKADAAALQALQPGPAKGLAGVPPGAGFVWARVDPKVLAGWLGLDGEAPAELKDVAAALTGEALLAGDVEPGAIYVQLGVGDEAVASKVVEQLGQDTSKLPKTIPTLKDSTIAWQKTSVQTKGGAVDALHATLGGWPQAGVLKAYAGLNPQAWMFAADSKLNLALGPDAANVGKLVEPGAGPRSDTLAELPPELGESLGKGEVSLVAHVPVDFLHGAPLRRLLEATFKGSPHVKPDQIRGVMALLAPLSSATAWVAHPAGAPGPILHQTTQAIGNRVTDEGKLALDAAHKVATGGDPGQEFAAIITKYGTSPMAFAYHVRAGDEGPGSLVGSGLGAVAVTASLMYPWVAGIAASATLADDLGIKADDPPPPLDIPTKPVTPKHKKVDPKPKPKPKPDPKPVEPPKPDPKPVEPPKPTPDPKKPPKPTPDPKPVEPPKPTPDPKKPKVEPAPTPVRPFDPARGRRPAPKK